MGEKLIKLAKNHTFEVAVMILMDLKDFITKIKDSTESINREELIDLLEDVEARMESLEDFIDEIHHLKEKRLP